MEKLKAAVHALGMEYTEKMDAQFRFYMEGVLSRNREINLTAITDEEEFITKHFIDSVLCADMPEMHKATAIIDIGTGAGFPGVPLAILFPKKSFVLADSLKKRLNIIEELCAGAGIFNVTVVHARAEDLAKSKEHREAYDLCISRAVANMATLAEYCLPFIKQGGYFLAYKGPDAEAELSEARGAIFLLGGNRERIHGPRQELLPLFPLQHKIAVIKEIKGTPSKYPRKAGLPSKEPLK